ncbi:hypothetical protein ACA910_013066 [Epithemia clementina (nom. ined.)]
MPLSASVNDTTLNHSEDPDTTFTLLRQQLQEKEEALMDVSVTLATVQAETTYRLKQMEQASQRRLLELEQQVRRLQHEANLAASQAQKQQKRQLQHQQQLQENQQPLKQAAAAADDDDPLKKTATTTRQPQPWWKQEPQEPPSATMASVASKPSISAPATDNVGPSVVVSASRNQSHKRQRPSSSSSSSSTTRSVTSNPRHQSSALPAEPQQDDDQQQEAVETWAASSPSAAAVGNKSENNYPPDSSIARNNQPVLQYPHSSPSLFPSLPLLLIQLFGDSDRGCSSSAEAERPTDQHNHSSTCEAGGDSKEEATLECEVSANHSYSHHHARLIHLVLQSTTPRTTTTWLVSQPQPFPSSSGNDNNDDEGTEIRTVLCLLQEILNILQHLNKKAEEHESPRTEETESNQEQQDGGNKEDDNAVEPQRQQRTLAETMNWLEKIFVTLQWLHQALLWSPKACFWILEQQQRRAAGNKKDEEDTNVGFSTTTVPLDLFRSLGACTTLRFRSKPELKKGPPPTTATPTATSPDNTASTTRMNDSSFSGRKSYIRWREQIVRQAIQSLRDLALFYSVKHLPLQKDLVGQYRKGHKVACGAKNKGSHAHGNQDENDHDPPPLLLLLQLQVSTLALRTIQVILAHIKTEATSNTNNNSGQPQYAESTTNYVDANNASPSTPLRATMAPWLELVGFADSFNTNYDGNDQPQHEFNGNRSDEGSTMTNSDDCHDDEDKNSQKTGRLNQNLLLLLFRRATDIQIAKTQHELSAVPSARRRKVPATHKLKRAVRRTASLYEDDDDDDLGVDPLLETQRAREQQLQQEHIERALPTHLWVSRPSPMPSSPFLPTHETETDKSNTSKDAARRVTREREQLLMDWMTAAMSLLRQVWRVSRFESEHWLSVWMMPPHKRTRFLVATILDWIQLGLIPQIKWRQIAFPSPDNPSGEVSVGFECVLFLSCLLQEPHMGGHAMLCTQMGAASIVLIPSSYRSRASTNRRNNIAMKRSIPPTTRAYSSIGVLSQLLFALVQLQQESCEYWYYNGSESCCKAGERNDQNVIANPDCLSPLRDAIVCFFDGLLRITQFKRVQHEKLEESKSQQKNNVLTFWTQTLECHDKYTGAISVLLTASMMENKENKQRAIATNGDCSSSPQRQQQRIWKSLEDEVNEDVRFRRRPGQRSSRIIPVASSIVAMLRLQLDELEMDQEDLEEEERRGGSLSSIHTSNHQT